jgi:hypothetical protein
MLLTRLLVTKASSIFLLVATIRIRTIRKTGGLWRFVFHTLHSSVLCPLILIFQTIVRAECRRLCGAVEYSEINARKNTYSIMRRKYILPDPNDTPRHDANGTRLHNPQWGRPATNHINDQFIDAVIDAVQLVPVSCTSWQYMSCI